MAELRPEPGEVVRVVVADDNEVVRQGLRALLETSSEVEVVGEARNGEEAVEVTLRLRPDVLLLDVRMPRRDGVAVAQELSSRCRVLMLTLSDEPTTIRDAMRAGAVGYLVHGHFDARSLVGDVLRAARGGGVFSPQAVEALRAVVAQPIPDDADRSVYGLTAREAEVMELLAAGVPNRTIARELFLAEKTVKNHVNRIFAKLQVSTRAEAVAVWLRGRPGA